MRTKPRQIESLLCLYYHVLMVSGGQDWDPLSPGTVSWPLCYCYDGSMRLEAVNNIHYMRKIWLKVNWQFYYFISYLEDVLRLYIIEPSSPGKVLQPQSYSQARLLVEEHCLVELSGVWVLQIAANTPWLQGRGQKQPASRGYRFFKKIPNI